MAKARGRDRLYGLRKSDRLRLRSLVTALFQEGRAMSAYPLRMVWRKVNFPVSTVEKAFVRPPGVGKLQMMVTVPKRKRRHAVDRVAMRRRIREAYRLNRLDLEECVMSLEGIDSLSVAFIYTAEKNYPYSKIEERMKRLLDGLRKELEAPASENPQL